jgi:hypothetical protein
MAEHNGTRCEWLMPIGFWMGAGVAFAITATCSYAYGVAQGSDAVVLGLVSKRTLTGLWYATIDFALALSALGVYRFCRKRQFVVAFGALVACLVCLPFACMNAVGYLGGEMVSASVHRSHDAGSYAALEAEVVRIRSEMGWIPDARPPGVVAADIAEKEASEAFGPTRTKGCTDVTRDDSRKFCDEYRKLQTELARAGERVRASEKLKTAENRLSDARPVVAGNPLYGRLAGAIGITEADTGFYIAAFLALAGLFIATSFPVLAEASAPDRPAPVQIAPSAPVAAEAPRPAIVLAPISAPDLQEALKAEERMQIAEVRTEPEPEKTPSTPPETAVGQASDSLDPFEMAVAQWAWTLPVGDYEVADLKARFKKGPVAERGLPVARINQIGTILESLGYPKVRPNVKGQRRVTLIRVQRRLAKVG